MLSSIVLAVAATAPVAVEPGDIAAFRSGNEDMSRLYLVALVSEGDEKVRMRAEAEAVGARACFHWRESSSAPRIQTMSMSGVRPSASI